LEQARAAREIQLRHERQRVQAVEHVQAVRERELRLQQVRELGQRVAAEHADRLRQEDHQRFMARYQRETRRPAAPPPEREAWCVIM
jgi:hypothetical protein